MFVSLVFFDLVRVSDAASAAFRESLAGACVPPLSSPVQSSLSPSQSIVQFRSKLLILTRAPAPQCSIDLLEGQSDDAIRSICHQSAIFDEDTNCTNHTVDIMPWLKKSKALRVGDARNHIPGEDTKPVTELYACSAIRELV